MAPGKFSDDLRRAEFDRCTAAILSFLLHPSPIQMPREPFVTTNAPLLRFRLVVKYFVATAVLVSIRIAPASAAAELPQRPNIILVMTDDRGMASWPATAIRSSKRRISTGSPARACVLPTSRSAPPVRHALFFDDRPA